MRFSVGDASYSYEVFGEGMPVVLLHGFTGSISTWSTFVSKWKNSFQLIVIDLPGHGKTRTKTPRTMESCCNDLAKLFEDLQLSKFHLIGYSMGGRTALSFAMLYPEWISSLILESTSPGIQSHGERIKRVENDEKLAQRIEAEGIPAFIKFWESIPLFASQRNIPIDVQQEVQKERLAQSKEGLAASLRWMGTGKQPSWWLELTKFTGPVLLIVGALDKKFVKINEQMEKCFPLVDLVEIENAGHAIHVEEPEKFGKLVVEFILKIHRNNSQGGF